MKSRVIVLTKVEHIHIHITASSYTSQHERTFPSHHRPLEQHCQTDAVSLTHSLLPPLAPLARLPPAWFAYKHHKPVLQPGLRLLILIQSLPHGSRDLSARLASGQMAHLPLWSRIASGSSPFYSSLTKIKICQPLFPRVKILFAYVFL